MFTRTAKWLLLIAAVLGVLAMAFGRLAQGELSALFVLRAKAPVDSVVQELVTHAKAPAALLIRLWATEKISHRLQVLNYLRDHCVADRELFEASLPLLHAATRDVDLDVRELAFGILAMRKHPDVVGLATVQLQDKDPQIRRLGLQYLRNQRHLELVPLVFALLDDPEPLVLTSADSMLRRWTQQDFGLRMAIAIPTANQTQTEKLTPDRLAALAHGVAQWKDWWKTHQQDYPAPLDLTTAMNLSPVRLHTSDFSLPDLAGNQVRLTDFKGKAVLLNFWTTWCSGCLVEMPDLVELQRRHVDRLVILGISLDGVPDAHDHGEEGKGDHGKLDLVRLRAKVNQVATAKRLNYRVLLDPHGFVGTRFNGYELPTNVLIDREGLVRRRFVGGRSLAAWEAMFQEMSEAGAPAKQMAIP